LQYFPFDPEAVVPDRVNIPKIHRKKDENYQEHQPPGSVTCFSFGSPFDMQRFHGKDIILPETATVER